MKKIIAVSAALAVGVLSAGSAFAAAGVNVLTGSGQIKTTDCTKNDGVTSQLTNDISVNLSTNVVGAYVCDVLSAANTNYVYVGTCHTSGSVKSRSITCSYGSATSGNKPKNAIACPDVAFDAANPAPLPTVTGSGATVYTANSNGGTVAGGFQSVDGALCDAAGTNLGTTVNAQAQ